MLTELGNGVVLLVDNLPARQWKGLGLRTSLKFENLDNRSESLIGPFQYKSEAIKAIRNYSALHPDDSFNIYCCGQYIGGTEV